MKEPLRASLLPFPPLPTSPPFFSPFKADTLSHKVTNAALSLSILPGEVVAILVPSCPEYVCMWIGMAR